MTVRRLNRYEVIQIRRLRGIENFVSGRDEFTFNSFRRTLFLHKYGLFTGFISSADAVSTVLLYTSVNQAV